MNEMNIESIDLHDKIRQRIELRFDHAPIVIRGPVAREFLHRRELQALRFVRDCFPFRPLSCTYTSAQFRKFFFGGVEGERTDRIAFATFLGGNRGTSGKQSSGTCSSRGGQYAASSWGRRFLEHDHSPLCLST